MEGDRMHHPNENRPIFQSFDESMTDPGKCHLTYAKRIKDYAEEVENRMGHCMEFRMGPSARTPFTEEYMADQHEQFEKIAGVIASKSDSMIADINGNQKACLGLPDPEDTDSKGEDELEL